MQNFVSIRFSQHDRAVLHVIQRARAQAPLHLPHKFFDVKSFYKILPPLPVVIAKYRLNASGIGSRHAVFVRRLGDLVSAKKCEQGEGFVKFCAKKACVGDGGELERALDDVFGIKVTVRSCCKSCPIPNGKLLPNLSSSRLFLSSFLIGFSCSPTAEITRLELEFEESLPRKTASIFKEGIGQESNGAANQENQIFLLCQISPSASSTGDLETRLVSAN